MWKEEWNIAIREVWCYFSSAVSKKEIADWQEEFKEEFSGKLVFLTDIRQLVFYEGKETKEQEEGIFLITDSKTFYEAAYKKKIPFLLYLHEGNTMENFSNAPFATTGLSGIDYEYMEKIYKRFFGIPWTILTTKRCIVREFTEEDLDELYEVYADPSISRYTEGLYADREQERKYIRDYIEQVYKLCGFGIWAVISRETGKLIGRAGIAWREGYDTPELGYVIGVPYQRKGIASEVCGKILEFAREGLGFEKIRVLFVEENKASLRLCRKLGFKKDEDVYIDGKQMQQYIYTGEA
ncbi:MAG: GNAT family N-acetyltransferase [Lachnospiraceae bacterium]|nr:GNAT family N-acetyltransferase [Lachnospiraceae bacterium]